MTIPGRTTFLNDTLGRPWQANAKGPDAFDCWHLAAYASQALFQRPLPAIAVPDAPTWPWMIDTIRNHPERANWRECPAGPLVQAKDGAIVLMARMTRPAHIGLWLAAERAVLHCDPRFGVVLEKPLELVTAGWRRLRWYEPVRADLLLDTPPRTL